MLQKYFKKLQTEENPAAWNESAKSSSVGVQWVSVSNTGAEEDDKQWDRFEDGGGQYVDEQEVGGGEDEEEYSNYHLFSEGRHMREE